jgi:hypothetical protein
MKIGDLIERLKKYDAQTPCAFSLNMEFLLLMSGTDTRLVEKQEYVYHGLEPRDYFIGSPAGAVVRGTITMVGEPDTLRELDSEYVAD